MLSKEVLRHVSVKEAHLNIARIVEHEREKMFSHTDDALFPDASLNAGAFATSNSELSQKHIYAFEEVRER